MKYLAAGRPAYVSREKIDVFEALGLLRESGAAPVLAHPLLIENIELDDFLRLLKFHGLEGVEVNYIYRKSDLMNKIDYVGKLTEELGLIATGGSDFHGDKGHSELGSTGVSVATIDLLRKASEQIHGS